MRSNSIFPKLWRRQQNAADTPDKPAPTEAPVNNSHAHAMEGLTGPQGNLLSYDDIYRAAGILGPRTGYSINQVVAMLESDHIRGLSQEVKRASVLMALDAASTPVDDLLQDATRRQQALSTYEAGQRKQVEEFEARKVQENTQIQAEMERVTAHYTERIKHNQEQVAQEKEALRNWQMVKQQESQRIAEVIELCSKQPASAPRSDVQSALSGPSASTAPVSSTPVSPNTQAKAAAK